MVDNEHGTDMLPVFNKRIHVSTVQQRIAGRDFIPIKIYHRNLMHDNLSMQKWVLGSIQYVIDMQPSLFLRKIAGTN